MISEELIEELKKYPPDMQVCIIVNCLPDDSNQTYNIDFVSLGKCKTRGFPSDFIAIGPEGLFYE